MRDSGKKVFEFIKSAINALIGSLTAIGAMEAFNVIVSCTIGKYERMDGGILSEIKKYYIITAIIGYGCAWLFIICQKLSEDENKDIIDKTKITIISSWVLVVLASSIISILLEDLHLAIVVNGIFSVLFGIILFIIYIYDKAVIKKINEKVKEKKLD